MPRGNASKTICHFKGEHDDFIVFVESAEAVASWKKDKTIPLAQVVDGYKVFVTHKHGTQGVLDTASKGTLDTEFGTNKDDDVVAQILEKGTTQQHEEHGRGGDTNISMGGKVSHN